MLLRRFWFFLPLLVLSHTARAEEVRSLHADLTFWFDCPMEVSEASVEQFLKSQKFEVLNVGRIQRERAQQTALVLFIDGIDQYKRMLRVTSLPGAPTSYNLALYTPPPTVRATALESAVIAFTAATLKCQLRDLVRATNGPEKQAYYGELYSSRVQSFVKARDWASPRL